MFCSLISLCLVATAQPALFADEGSKPRAWNTSHSNWQKPHPAVVRIIVDDGNGTSYGSGTLIARSEKVSMVITNWHVIRDAKGEITVAFPDGFRSSARIAKMDRNWDLAALVIWSPQVEPVAIAQQAPRPGDPLTIAGYGSGQYQMSSGLCTQYVAPGLNFPYEMVEISAEARQGDSGGPIFNQQGELAGVLFGAGRGTTSGSYSGRVQQFLQPLLLQLKPQRSVGQLASTSIPAETDEPSQEKVASAGNSQPAGEAADQESTDQQPIPDPDQEALPKDMVAQLPEQATTPAAVADEEHRQDSPQANESAEISENQQASEIPEFRLVAVPSNRPYPSSLTQQPVSADSKTGFKIVPFSDQLGTGSNPALTWQKLAGKSLSDQAKSLLAVIGLFYLGLVLLRRSD